MFAVIGAIGLLLTEGGMFLGYQLLHINYMIVKLFVAAFVLLWNYGARKILIFKDDQSEWNKNSHHYRSRTGRLNRGLYAAEGDGHPSDSIGGERVYRRHFAHGRLSEQSDGHWRPRFFSKSDAVTALWKELMPVQGAPARDESAWQAKTAGGRRPGSGTGGPGDARARPQSPASFTRESSFDYPISLKPQTIANMGFRRTMQAGFG